ncbi:acetyltransferase [Achromobacter sp. SD115]|uniref:GNAT family N-acetyltransferase n=1 Tax=Achromobacter sp. SD115 TaxID=2782011 RepID=UPI001A962D48|nr:GNAT family N-acetyltransferase [Achromobacter sp. SD115]MBO1014336.1 acetyltransferase [Achromobacter sp. SD115]
MSSTTRNRDISWPRDVALRSYPYGQHFSAQREGDQLLLWQEGCDQPQIWPLYEAEGTLLLQAPDGAGEVQWLAALESTFTSAAGQARCDIVASQVPRALLYSGVARAAGPGRWQIEREVLFQYAPLWLTHLGQPTPLRYHHDKVRHPLRPPKPTGLLYQRYIPWLKKTFSYRALDIEADLALFSRWMNDPDVVVIWQEEGTLEQHRHYLQTMAADPHVYPMIASLDGEPFGYFEVYWAKENRIGPFCEADDYDRGWHVLIGEPAFRGKAFATAWLTSISHYMLLDDARTRRAVGEPRRDHLQQIRNLDRSGYAKVKEFDFPHKRALLVTLLRERFFADALWWPCADAV